MLIGAPLALYLSAAARGYPLQGRHFIFIPPVALAAMIYLAYPLLGVLRSLNQTLPKLTGVASIAASLALTSIAFGQISDQLRPLARSSPAKVSFPFVQWRNAYLSMPNRRQLVIVGYNPELNNTDTGEYLGRMPERFYAKDLKPFYLSKQGLHGPDKKALPTTELKRILAQPTGYDFLLLAPTEALRELHPGLPWKSWDCTTQNGFANLSFCKLEALPKPSKISYAQGDSP
jgi:hypothetical protein